MINSKKLAWQKEYAKTLRILMRKKKISIRDMAIQVGVSKSAMERYVHGDCLPDVYVAEEIKKILND